MKAVIQRVSHASVVVDGKTTGSINQGLLILLGVGPEDDASDIEWLSSKILKMRIFSDSEGKMNLSSEDVKGGFLVVSQFTLMASTKKGNRPSYIQAAKPDLANSLYEDFCHKLESISGKTVAKGVFGADMKVSLLNDGPVTIIIDSKNKI